MAFWRLGNGFSSISGVDKILEKPDRTLDELLDEQDLLQELHAPNTRLVEFLRTPEVMAQLIQYIVSRPQPKTQEDESMKEAEDSEEQGEGKSETGADEPGSRQDKDAEDSDLVDSSVSGSGFTSSGSGVAAADSKIGDCQQHAGGSTNKAAPESAEGAEHSSGTDDKDGNAGGAGSGGSDSNDADSTGLDTAAPEDADVGEKMDTDQDGMDSIKRRLGLLDGGGGEHTRSPPQMGMLGQFSSDGEDDDEDEDDEDEEDIRNRYAQLGAEILSADVWSLTEALMSSPEYLDGLWMVLDSEVPLDVSRASYFTKISEHLLDKKTEDMLGYIRNQPQFVTRFMKHIDNPPVMDFLLKVISTDKAENSTGIIDFLQQQGLIANLISFLGPQIAPAVQSAAGDFLKAFVTISANSNTDANTIGPNELSRELVSEPIVQELVRLMLFGGTGLATGVGVIIEIIRKNNSDYDFVPIMCVTMDSHPPGPRDPIYLGGLVKIFARHIPQFQAMLTKSRDSTLHTPIGLAEPLGFERFKICELFAELLHCSNMALLNDDNGESVVKERDEERDRIKRVIARARGDVVLSSFDEDEGNHDAVSGPPPTPPPKAKEESDNIESAISNLDIDTKPLDAAAGAAGDGKTSDPVPSKVEAAIERLGSEELVETEQALRKDPVPGDQLKIALADNDCVVTILTMFFKFPWNNFLHNVVYDVIQQILNGPMKDGYNRFLAIDLFGKGALTEAICNGHSECQRYQQEHNTRLGYMGHLTLISEEVVKFRAVFPPETISPVIVAAVTNPEWMSYVTNILSRTRDQYNLILGGQRPEDSAETIRNPNAIILKNGSDNDDDEDEDGMHHDDDDDDLAGEFGEDLKSQPTLLHPSSNRTRLDEGELDDEDDEHDLGFDHDQDD